MNEFRPRCLLPARECTLWGVSYEVKPALVKRKFGDGNKLLALAPTMHRPNYYLVWIDSSWSTDSDELFERLDEIYEAIEDEFGCRPEGSEDYEWPEADFDGGSSWWTPNPKEELEESGD